MAFPQVAGSGPTQFGIVHGVSHDLQKPHTCSQGPATALCTTLTSSVSISLHPTLTVEHSARATSRAFPMSVVRFMAVLLTTGRLSHYIISNNTILIFNALLLIENTAPLAALLEQDPIASWRSYSRTFIMESRRRRYLSTARVEQNRERGSLCARAR
jgi:hypothetical protein